jgi:selenocysteine lyase/cysteine desulfurase
VAIGHQVSPLAALMASSLRRGANILAPEGDFTSLLFHSWRPRVRSRAPRSISSRRRSMYGPGPVAVSAVQSLDGRIADLEAIASAAAHHRALTLIDATQASGWLPLDASRRDILVTGGYKWLCHPRGTAFMTVRPDIRDRLVPAAAGWDAAEEPWQTRYGTPLRLADDARWFDVSPAWLSWHATAAALELFEAAGIERIHEHDITFANRLRTGLDLDPGDSAIVSFVKEDDAARRLASADVRVSLRGGRVPLSCHIYNENSDIDRALEALSRPPGRVAVRN